ncbi:unnamed protein product [Diplocarpon coronariae]|nr:hypothetical protein JHW43_008294 [Diplocarpon mali]
MFCSLSLRYLAKVKTQTLLLNLLLCSALSSNSTSLGLTDSDSSLSSDLQNARGTVPNDGHSSSSSATLLSDPDYPEEDHAYEPSKSLHDRLLPAVKHTTCKAILAVAILLPWALLPVIFKLGQHSGEKVLPKLPTHAITRSPVEYRLQILGDEFYTTEPENLKYKGHPRPELDVAWNELIEYMHQRVHKDEAKAAGFESTELADGSGDVTRFVEQCFRTSISMIMTVSHQDPTKSMCTWTTALTSLICQGDMPMYYFYWPETPGRITKKYPRHVGHKEHVCVDLDLLQETHKRRFSLLSEQKLLVNPFYPEGSLNDVVVPKRTNYSVCDSIDLKGPESFEGLEDLAELARSQKGGK